jgi:hypothetical protein
VYSPLIVDRRLHQAKKDGLKCHRRPREESIDIAAKLQLLTLDRNGEPLPAGQLSRDLDEREREFIASEQVLCKADFAYYLTRYHVVERDPGVGTESGNGAAKLLESQRKFIMEMGKREEVCHAEVKKYGHTSGILVYAHKCRQVAFTATARGASIHRMILWPGTRAFAATLKDGPQGTGELYKRDLLALTSLPFWLGPMLLYPNVKDQEIGIRAPLNARLSYQAENQQTGIGTGTQQDVSHLTEVSLWLYPSRIRYSFVPSIPKAISTLHIQEATSAGRGGYWHEVTEACRHRRAGFEDWIYIFVPWYMNRTKYRGNPPDSWIPDDKTVQHAALIERTSPEFCEGRTFHPGRDQMYWWEKTRALHAAQNETAAFLANYPATPEQSFVNASQGALPVELIEEMEFETRDPRPYEVECEVPA